MKGWVMFRLGNLKDAQNLAEQVLELCNTLDIEDLRGNTLNLLGAINIVSGQYDKAATVFEEAHTIFQRLGDRPHAMTIVNNLGWLAETRGDYQLANQRYAEALKFAHETGHRDAEMVYLSNLGGTRVMLEDYSGAEKDLRQVIEMASGSGLGVLSETYRALAEACCYQGNRQEALDSAQRALALGREVSSQDYIAAAWRVLGLISSFQGEPVEAVPGEDVPYDGEACYSESLRICDEGNLDGEKARTLRAWARHKLAQGDHLEGEKLWQEARDIFARLGAVLEVERMAQLPTNKHRS
jgi:tetratricopeptide (TPR) repeat protein